MQPDEPIRETRGNPALAARLKAMDATVMAELRPFQKATVEHIDRLYREGLTRVLVADEVGLGKTMVARGVLAKLTVLRHEEHDELVKAVYICSNAAIADQNLRSLALDRDVKLKDARTSRLSMQHLTLAQERIDRARSQLDHYLQLIPLTPYTSFKVGNSAGTMDERALMAQVLAFDERFQDTSMLRFMKKALWLPRSNSHEHGWNDRLKYYEEAIAEAHAFDIQDASQADPYPVDILKSVADHRDADGWNPLDDLVALCTEARGHRRYIERNRDRCVAIVKGLRRAFSLASVEQMEPDLVIMDEFQRFSDLIRSGSSEMSILAERFLTAPDPTSPVRVLLLSATPFRIYATADEVSDEGFADSFQEFSEVISFLSSAETDAAAAFHESWSTYSHELHKLGDGAGEEDVLIQTKQAAESALVQLIARTERTSTGELDALAQSRTLREPLTVTKRDIRSYVDAQRLLEKADLSAHLLPPDYVKSCPYIMSYLRGYKVFDRLSVTIRDNAVVKGAIRKFLSTEKGIKQWLWVPEEKILNYENIHKAIPNAKYQAFSEGVFDGARQRNDSKGPRIPVEKLLWIPPSLPYYEPPARSPFFGAEGLSKTIVFSAWAMVPPALSTLLSYEAEQRLVAELSSQNNARYAYRWTLYREDEQEGDSEFASRIPQGNLTWKRRQRRDSNAHLLIYPSPYLAKLFADAAGPNIKDALPDQGKDVPLPKLKELRTALARRICTDLKSLPAMKQCTYVSRRPVGSRTYLFAAMLLDEQTFSSNPDQILAAFVRRAGSSKLFFPEQSAERLARAWADDLLDDYAEWKAGLGAGYALPHDLFAMLADAALGSPAVCASRAYDALFPDAPFELISALALEFGVAFCTKMNTGQATMAVMTSMGRYRTDQGSHWKNQLGYCCEGNFQALLDEYFFQLYSKGSEDPETALIALHEEVIGPRIGRDHCPSLYKADTNYVVEQPEALFSNTEQSLRMRTNFAAAFRDGTESTSGNGLDRRTLLRRAFNSPFRPFVLVSTSIGQEGLDFHRYCRRIVHWNIPSNPIDFEQREGRVNRFRGLSIRQSVAARYGATVLEHAREGELGDEPIWEELFQAAKEGELAEDSNPSGLVPDWGVRNGDGLVTMERVLYEYPFSRDIAAYDRLLELCAHYRAVMGQPNQEALLRDIERTLESGEFRLDLRELFVNLSPFARNSLRYQ